jgi:transcriptional regulator with PAS, ATPase and Fis domain
MDYNHYTKSQLIDMLVKLKWDFDNLQAMFDSPNELTKGGTPSGSNPYALFQVFVNDHRKCLVLIDISYQVCYINGNAAKLLRLRTPEALYGRNIFDLIKREDALKLKEVIDRTYLYDNKEKLASLNLATNDGIPCKVKVSALRVRFNDQTTVQLRLKTA